MTELNAIRLIDDDDIAIHDDVRIALLIPCYNEEATIAKMIGDFRAALPTASIYVYDNNSSDGTAARAQAAGALVRHEPMRGKGNVVRRMFADVEADIYILVDGDDTYDAASAPLLIDRLIKDDLDMVNAARVSPFVSVFPPGHRFGNILLTRIVTSIFGNRVVDMLSGYKAFSRRFVKSFPALSRGFEIETELTIHALELRMQIGEVSTPYRERPPGSTSKLRTFRDGFRILGTIAVLVKEERPLASFSILALLLACSAMLLAWPVVVTFFETGLVPRLPTAVLSTGMMLLSFLGLACGLILDTVTRGRAEMKRMFYLGIPAQGCVRLGTQTSGERRFADGVHGHRAC